MAEQQVVMEVRGLKKHYPVGGGMFGGSRRILHALDGVDMTVSRGEILGIVGESGCGKSTLGRSMLRLFPVTAGEILFNGQDITHLGPKALLPYRRQMQMIFQNPFASFNPKQRIGTALREVGHVHGMSDAQMTQRIGELMEVIHLPEEMLYRSPGELSGGQLQRLAIARALMLSPEFVVADEPVSALDVSVQAQILNLITDLRKSQNLTMLFISHEMTVVEHMCDRVAVMYLGKVVELAPTQALFADMRHPYTQALMSAVPAADPESRTQRIVLEGDIPSAMDLPAGCRFAGRCRYCTGICREQEPELKDIGAGHLAACHHQDVQK